MGKLKDIQKQFDAVYKQMKTQGLQAFKEAAKEVLAEYPEVTGFKWNQYTPSWNDGSPCTFHLNDESLQIQRKLPKGQEEWTDKDDVDEDGWTSEGEGYPDDLTDAAEAAAELLGPEELLETLFGTNVTVIVTREKITTEEYDCGY